jgi:membrane protein DedA with SNARE-associated domain
VTPDTLLTEYGSALILPLSVIEGPIVTVVTGFLSQQGYFTWVWAVILLVCGDLIGDVLYYWIGRGGGPRLAGIARRVGLHSDVPDELRHELTEHSTRMLIIGKWTHSIGCLVLIGSGMLHLPLPRFLLINLLATVPKTGALFAFGYYASSYFPRIEQHAILATVLLATIGVAAIALVFRRRVVDWAAGARR